MFGFGFVHQLLPSRNKQANVFVKNRKKSNFQTQTIEYQTIVLFLTCLCVLNVTVPPSGSLQRAAPETEVCVWARWNVTV